MTCIRWKYFADLRSCCQIAVASNERSRYSSKSPTATVPIYTSNGRQHVEQSFTYKHPLAYGTIRADVK